MDDDFLLFKDEEYILEEFNINKKDVPSFNNLQENIENTSSNTFPGMVINNNTTENTINTNVPDDLNWIFEPDCRTHCKPDYEPDTFRKRSSFESGPRGTKGKARKYHKRVPREKGEEEIHGNCFQCFSGISLPTHESFCHPGKVGCTIL